MSSKHEKLFEEVKQLSLPLGSYAVVGGGALAARGIRDYNDVDLLLAEDLYERLKREGWEEKAKKPGVFHLYNGNAEAARDFTHIEGCTLTTEGVIERAELIEGVPVMTLEDLSELKQTMGRDNDLKDLKLIEEYLANR